MQIILAPVLSVLSAVAALLSRRLLAQQTLALFIILAASPLGSPGEVESLVFWPLGTLVASAFLAVQPLYLYSGFRARGLPRPLAFPVLLSLRRLGWLKLGGLGLLSPLSLLSSSLSSLGCPRGLASSKEALSQAQQRREQRFSRKRLV